MKTVLITPMILFAVFLLNPPCNAQFKPERILLMTAGVSQITGYTGIEWFLGKVSVDLGVGYLVSDQSGQSRGNIGVGLTLYTDVESQCSYYVSAGCKQNGTLHDNNNGLESKDTQWADSYTLIAGMRLVSKGIVSVKAGAGYCWSKYCNSLTGEIKVGIRMN